MTSRQAINAAVKEAWDHGLAVVPPREDGSKAPAAWWKDFQTERPSLEMLREYYREERHGLGTLGGPVSGELEVFEIESDEIWKRFRCAMADGGYEDLLEKAEEGYLEQAPRGGVHYLWRTERAGANRKLAMSEDFDVWIETRASGGFCILAPSYGPVHPTGRPYVRLSGSFSTIPFFDQQERDVWFRVAAALDRRPRVDDIPYRPAPDDTDESFPGNDFNRRGKWDADVLCPAGWTMVSRGHDQEGRVQEFWRRPGKDRGNSAVLHPEAGPGGLFVCFSTSTPIPETELGYSKWRTYAWLHHGGDFRAAARELKRRGFGKSREERIWTPPPTTALWGDAVFDLDVPEVETLPILGQGGMVVDRGANLLYAFPKVGKTELIRHVLQEWIELGKRVVYLTEEPLWFWKPRLRYYDHPSEFWRSVLFVPAFGWGITEILEFLGQVDGTDIVVADTLRNVCGYQEARGDEDVNRIVAPLIATVRDKGATLLALYHARKMPGEGGRDISGHHSLYGVFDRALQLKEVSGEENKSKRRLSVSGRLLSPDTPNGLTYEMTAGGKFRALDVKNFTGWQKTCEVCGNVLDAQRSTAKYCSDTCRQRAKRERDTDGE
jgi:Bifunctional DNA primase/polymerase, N-terminal